MNHYSTLGVNSNATPQEIKKAYKKASMQHHPDRGGNSDEFVKIQAAYETLRDPAKKQQYDNPQPQQQHHPFGQQHQSFEDIFGGAFGFGGQQTRQMRNRDVNIEYGLTFEELFTGKTVNIQYRIPSGRIEILDAAVPPGVKQGDQVRFAGKGDDSFPQVPRGNLVLSIKVRPHANWKRDGDNITTTQNISVFDLMLGSTIEVRTPAGRNFNLTVPKGTKSGTVFSITGQGIPNVNSRRPGNAHIKVDSIVPRIQDETILQKLKDIKDEIDKLT